MKRTLITLVLCGPLLCFSQKVTHPAHIPQGMKLVWSDEFNDGKFNKDKWSTHYYSTFDFAAKTNFEDFRKDNLPQPVMTFSDSTITLYTTDSLPERTYWPESGRKISSIQTYDWNSDKNLLGDKFVGGYIEARLRRTADDDATMVNGAFWLDSPGPDMKYYIESGNEALDSKGIRPPGQIFEIDLCENLNTEIVLHGNVDGQGKFLRNMGHHIVKGDFVDKWVTHGILWSPAGLKFYIDGKLIKEYWDPNDIKSPNHYMNIYLGMYAKGNAEMEVDYVRFYQWNLDGKNELPNGNFEYAGQLFPWEGSGSVSQTSAKSGKYGLTLKPGESVHQYVYLDHSKPYEISFSGKGQAVTVSVDNIEMVNGKSQSNVNQDFTLNPRFSNYKLKFTTTPEQLDHKKSVLVKFSNTSNETLNIDNIKIIKAL